MPNLDQVLGGGLLRGSTVMVIGPPGSGKTVLGQQIAFAGARRGEVALYFTGFSETYDKLLAHSQSLTFFAAELIGEQVHLASLPDLLEQGPMVAEEAVVETARIRRAALVILDGFGSMRGFMADNHTAARFIYSLGAKLALLGATLLVLVEGDANDRDRHPEQSVCDVIVSLSRILHAGDRRRQLEVLKVRGAGPLAGVHSFVIDETGLHVYPRLESVAPTDMPPAREARARLGVAEIDGLLGGGVNVGTTTLAAGAPGLGKTLLGLHFLTEGARQMSPASLQGLRRARSSSAIRRAHSASSWKRLRPPGPSAYCKCHRTISMLTALPG